MALIHRAVLKPTKLELLATWLPGRSWFQGPTVGETVNMGAYRFDDPAGEVGIETLLVRIGDGPVHQVPLTYRDAPLDGNDEWLVGTTEHSVLGPRWVYDGCGDPVYATALASVIFSADRQAQEFFEVDGELVPREPTMVVTGNPGAEVDVPLVAAIRDVVPGDPTLIVTDSVRLTVLHRLDRDTHLEGSTLTGTWKDQPTPLPLAYATPR
ncbi:hypothetical protein ACI2K4_04175 [Micromonospora sp. NPDC050397]|uniref:CG0192-related protein n=1 Tax=Micromonospora sp. NPDC050397 TaxID=3364279 RepID=UPI0038513353